MLDTLCQLYVSWEIPWFIKLNIKSNCCEFFPLRRFGDALFAPNSGCYDLIVNIFYFCNASRVGFLSISPGVDSNKCYLDINKDKGFKNNNNTWAPSARIGRGRTVQARGVTEQYKTVSIKEIYQNQLLPI